MWWLFNLLTTTKLQQIDVLVKSDIRQNKKYQYWDKAAAAFFLLVYMLLKIHWDPPSLDFKKKK